MGMIIMADERSARYFPMGEQGCHPARAAVTVCCLGWRQGRGPRPPSAGS